MLLGIVDAKQPSHTPKLLETFAMGRQGENGDIISEIGVSLPQWLCILKKYSGGGGIATLSLQCVALLAVLDLLWETHRVYEPCTVAVVDIHEN